METSTIAKFIAADFGLQGEVKLQKMAEKSSRAIVKLLQGGVASDDAADKQAPFKDQRLNVTGCKPVGLPGTILVKYSAQQCQRAVIAFSIGFRALVRATSSSQACTGKHFVSATWTALR